MIVFHHNIVPFFQYWMRDYRKIWLCFKYTIFLGITARPQFPDIGVLKDILWSLPPSACKILYLDGQLWKAKEVAGMALCFFLLSGVIVVWPSACDQLMTRFLCLLRWVNIRKSYSQDKSLIYSTASMFLVNVNKGADLITLIQLQG